MAHMSNLSQQFDANDKQRAAAIRNNKTRLTRVLKVAGFAPEKKTKSRSGKVSMSAGGVVYTPQGPDATLIHYTLSSGNRNPDLVEKYHGRILSALTDAGFNATMKDGKIHVQH